MKLKIDDCEASGKKYCGPQRCAFSHCCSIWQKSREKDKADEVAYKEYIDNLPLEGALNILYENALNNERIYYDNLEREAVDKAFDKLYNFIKNYNL